MNVGVINGHWFYFPSKAGATTSWVPSIGPEFPLETLVDYSEQLTGETAGGTLYVQDKGPKRERFDLQFALMSQVDRDSLLRSEEHTSELQSH